MSWEPPPPLNAAECRRRAEEQLRREESQDPGGDGGGRIVHELRVHQIELEMQNEALREARLEAEAGWERFQELFDFAPAGYFSVDRNGAILEVNLAGARLLGTDRVSLVDRRFFDFLDTDAQAAFKACLQQGLANQTVQPCEVMLGGRRVRLQSAQSADGKVLQLVAMDITELHEAQLRASQRATELEQQLAQLQGRA